MQQEFLHIDATPDESYPLRILQAYRRLGDFRWSDSSNDVSENNVLVKTMNELQEKRNALLDRAIALLATQQGVQADKCPVCLGNKQILVENAWRDCFACNGAGIRR